MNASIASPELRAKEESENSAGERFAEVAREQVFAGSEKWGLRVGDNGLGGTDFAWSDGNLYLIGSFWKMKVECRMAVSG